MKEKLLEQWNKLGKNAKLFVGAVGVIIVISIIQGIF